MRAARSRRACVHVPRHVLPRTCTHDLFPLTHTWRCTATQAQATRTLEGSLLLGHAVRGSWRWPLRRSGERDPPWLPRRAESKNHPIQSVHARSIQSIRRQGRVHADAGADAAARACMHHAWVRWPAGAGRLVCRHVVAGGGRRAQHGRPGRSHAVFSACAEAERRDAGVRTAKRVHGAGSGDAM